MKQEDLNSLRDKYPSHELKAQRGYMLNYILESESGALTKLQATPLHTWIEFILMADKWEKCNEISDEAAIQKIKNSKSAYCGR